MSDEKVEELTVSVNLDNSGFENGVHKTEKAFDDLEKILEKSARKTNKKAKKAKKDISDIAEETAKSGDAFKKSGKKSDSFFSPLTKGVFGFAASVFTLKNAIQQTVQAASRFGDIHLAAREVGLPEEVVKARRQTEEQFNIPQGTYEAGVRNIRDIQAKYRLGIPPSELQYRALTQLGVGAPELQTGDPAKILDKLLANSRKYNTQDRQAYLEQFSVRPYSSLNNEENTAFGRSLRENTSIETKRRKSGVYQKGEKSRQEYIKATQDFARAIDDFTIKALPLLTKIVEGLSFVTSIANGNGSLVSIPSQHKNDEVIKDSQRKYFNDAYSLKLPEGATYGDFWKERDRKYPQSKKTFDLSNLFSRQNHADDAAYLPQTSSNAVSKSIVFNQTNNITSKSPERSVKDLALNQAENRRLYSVFS